MQIHNLTKKNSILNTFISELRDVNVQKDRMRFRRNIERVGEVLGYELSKVLNYTPSDVKTPLGKSRVNLPQNDIVICSILRAGVPLHNGLLNYFDNSENAFISAYRHHKDNLEDFEIIVEYLACPNLDGKTLILADPMLATGQSLVSTYKALKPYGTPKEVHLVSVIAVAVITMSLMMIFNIDFVAYLNDFWAYSFDFTGLNSKRIIIATTILISYGTWASFFFIKHIKNKAKTYRPSFVLVIISSLIGLLIIAVSPNKTGSEFLFLFAPLAIIMTNYLEVIEETWFKEVIVWVLVITPIIALVL